MWKLSSFRQIIFSICLASFFLFCFTINIVDVSAIDPPKFERETIEHGAGYSKKSRQGELVEGFPVIPIPAKTKLLTSSVKNMGNLQGMQAVYQTELEVPQVVDFFHRRLVEEGWVDLTPTKSLYSKHEEFIEFQKEKIKINISVEFEDNETEISIEIPVNQTNN